MTTGYEGLAYPQFQPSPGRYVQRANEVLDYAIDWSDFLPDGDAIVSSMWVGNPGLALSQMSLTATTTTVWVGPAVYPDCIYSVFNTITTVGGRTATRELHFRIKTAPFAGNHTLYRTIHGRGELTATASAI